MTLVAQTVTKSLQSCPTLCDPIDSSPPGSPVPGILKARTLEWVAISFSNAWKWKVKLLSRVRLLVTPWTAAYQAPVSMGFSRQEYWSRVPSASLWILTNPPLIALSLNEFLQWDIRAWVSLVLAEHESPGESWRTGGKSSGKKVPRNPLHSQPENLLNIWPVLTISLGWLFYKWIYSLVGLMLKLKLQ